MLQLLSTTQNGKNRKESTQPTTIFTDTIRDEMRLNKHIVFTTMHIDE